jgi:hypothetical protein
MMEGKNMQPGRVIGNVGILDLRNASETSIAEISRIGNVGTILYSRETAGLVTRLTTGNLGSAIEVPADAKLSSGQTVFNRVYFEDGTTPLSLVVSGQLVIQPDVRAQDIEQGLAELVISGQLICPEHLLGLVQSKVRHISGQVVSYASESRLVLGRLVLDANALGSLEDESTLVVIGALHLPQVVANDVLKQKIKAIHVTGGVRCHEENAQVLLARMPKQPAKVTTIPAGFHLVDSPLVLDNVLLESLPAPRLYCTNSVQVDEDVKPSLLDSQLKALTSEDMVICPTTLQSVFSQKCNLFENRVLFYQGDLWMVDGEEELTNSRFDYLEGKATLVVRGELAIAPEVDPRLLVDRLDRVHNLGEIRCTPEQMGAIQARLGLSEGELQDIAQAETDKNGIGNVGYVAL